MAKLRVLQAGLNVHPHLATSLGNTANSVSGSQRAHWEGISPTRTHPLMTAFPLGEQKEVKHQLEQAECAQPHFIMTETDWGTTAPSEHAVRALCSPWYWE